MVLYARMLGPQALRWLPAFPVPHVYKPRFRLELRQALRLMHSDGLFCVNRSMRELPALLVNRRMADSES